jgi:hypothetical protein
MLLLLKVVLHLLHCILQVRCFNTLTLSRLLISCKVHKRS